MAPLACSGQHGSVRSSALAHHGPPVCNKGAAHVRGIKAEWPLCDLMITAFKNTVICPKNIKFGRKNYRFIYRLWTPDQRQPLVRRPPTKAARLLFFEVKSARRRSGGSCPCLTSSWLAGHVISIAVCYLERPAASEPCLQRRLCLRLSTKVGDATLTLCFSSSSCCCRHC